MPATLIALATLFVFPVQAQPPQTKGLGELRRLLLVAPHPNKKFFVDIGSMHRPDGWLVNAVADSLANEKSAMFTKEILAKVVDADLEADFNNALAALLRQRGYTVTIAPDREAGASRVGSAGYDAIVEVDLFAGYFANGPTTDYRPAAVLDVSAFSTADEKRLFGRRAEYRAPPTKLAAWGRAKYANVEALIADTPVAYAALKDYVVSACALIVANYLQCENTTGWRCESTRP